MNVRRIVPLLVAVALASLPAASAHSSVESSDGKYEFVIGLLNEPVVTYAKTGLDMCVKQMPANHDELEAQGKTVEGTAVNIDAGALTATLKSPDGKTLSQPLKGQYGRTGCYQFQNPFVLTMPGQYTVDVTGTVNGTAISFKDVKAGGAVGNESALTFPATNVQSLESLSAKNTDQAAQIAKLQQDLATLKTQVNSMKASQTSSKGAPSASVALILVVLGAAVVVLRRREP